MTHTTRNTLVTDLLPKITRNAHYCPTVGIVDEDDCTQEISERIINRLDADPARLTDTSSRLIWDGTRNGAWKAFRHEMIALKHIRGTPVSCTAEDDDYEIEEYIPDPSLTPEEIVIRRELYETYAEAIKKLTPSNKALVLMLAEGQSESEIAAALGISRPAVTQRKATVAKYLRAALSV